MNRLTKTATLGLPRFLTNDSIFIKQFRLFHFKRVECPKSKLRHQFFAKNSATRCFSSCLGGQIQKEIDSIKVFEKEKTVQVNLLDGRIINFNSIWLRDSCRCDACVHPVTKQKMVSSAGIDHQLKVDRINYHSDFIQIVWKDSAEKQHISDYQIDWIKMFSQSFEAGQDNLGFSSLPNDEIYSPKIRIPDEVYWDADLIENTDFQVEYKDLMNEVGALKKTANLICSLGIAFIQNVPLDKNEILNVARRIAYVRQTGYGLTFDVTFNPDPNTHLSYTGTKFEPHVDLAYRERSPGIQMLHCLEQASVGGQSMLVDGFTCADQLRKNNPDGFKVLTKYPVMFSFFDSQRSTWFREKWPVIATGSDDRLKEIHFSEFSMRPPLLPFDCLGQFYSAYKEFASIIRDQRMQLRFYMKPGDLLIFNNRRVLHGREEYDHLTEKRFLKGCYMDLDEVKSLCEKLQSSDK